jgi:hypothetical protein
VHAGMCIFKVVNARVLLTVQFTPHQILS